MTKSKTNKTNTPIQGVVTGCNQNHEWLLKGWWHHFSKHNTLPVAFVDFGMSGSAKAWCEKRGQVISMNPNASWITPKSKLTRATQKKWERLYAPTVWGARSCWLLKPAALLQSPFEKTAWVDLDCIIRGNIRPLIDASHCEAKFACVREVDRSIALSEKEGAIKKGWIGYNSGVFSFQKDSPIMNAWVELTMNQNHLHMGDSDTLNHVLNEGSFNFCELSDKFNRRPQDGILSNTLIAHYVCNGGKAELMNLFKSYEEQNNEKAPRT